MRSHLKRLLLLPVLLFGICAEATAEFAVEFGAENFRWREFDAGGRLLEESGRRYRIGGTWRQPLGADRRDALFVRAGLHFGSVDYDGQACDSFGSNCVPFQTDSDYFGASAEASFARRFGVAGNGELFAGAGIDSWERDVRGRAGVTGALEQWTAFYLFGGIGAHWQDTGGRIHLQAGAKYPFFTFEYADLYDIDLEPKGRLSWFARLATDFTSGSKPQWGLGIYYDSYRFDMSNVERTSGLFVWQPRSEQDVVGIYATVYLN